MGDINSKILGRRLATQFDEKTYYTTSIYDFYVDHQYDPDVLFKIKVYGYYAKTYKWSKSQADRFINENIKESRSWFSGNKEYLYDWGSGKNKVTQSVMHEPNLDHIVPYTHSKNNDPSNMRIRSRLLNTNKGSTETDEQRIATILDHFDDLENKTAAKKILIERLNDEK